MLMEGNKKLNVSKNNIGSLFDRIALKYDFLNHLLTLNIDKYWRKKAVKKIDNQVESLLDVATGTGDLAIEIIKQKKAKQIMAIDLSQNMLDIAKQKMAQRNLLDKIIFQQANCQNLPFKDESFDVICSAFGVRNFANLDKGLQEMYRVLKKDGKLIILELAYPSNKIIKTLYNFYFTTILPVIGKSISKDKTAYKYLPMSVKKFIYNQDFVDKLSENGFQEADYQTLTMGICSLYTARKK